MPIIGLAALLNSATPADPTVFLDPVVNSSVGTLQFGHDSTGIDGELRFDHDFLLAEDVFTLEFPAWPVAIDAKSLGIETQDMVVTLPSAGTFSVRTPDPDDNNQFITVFEVGSGTPFNVGTGNGGTASDSLVIGTKNTLTGEQSLVGGFFHNLNMRYGFVGGYRHTANMPNGDPVKNGVLLGGAYNSISEHYSSIIGGLENDASGGYSFVGGGKSNSVSGYYSAIVGSFDSGVSDHFAAIVGGHTANASGKYSAIVAGKGNTASGERSSIIGGTGNLAEGYASTALGAHSIATGSGQVVIGQYNVPNGDPIAANRDQVNDQVFTIGNGTADGARSNAFSVNWNGDTSVTGDLDVGGVIRVPASGDLSMGVFTNP